MKHDFLFECGCEEIPARFVSDLLHHLKRLFESHFEKARLGFESIETYGTYRRLVVKVNGLTEQQDVFESWVKGPPETIAFDSNTKQLTQAGLGFLKRFDVSNDDVTVKLFDGKPYLSFLKKEAIQSTLELLPTLIVSVLTELPLPIAMKWGNNEGPFVRPVHWFLALFGKDIVEFSCFGVTSSSMTYGHRCLSKSRSLQGDAFQISSFDQYCHILETQGQVMVDPEKRREFIVTELSRLGQSDPDEALLNEVVYLVEFPCVLQGVFEQRFLDVPAVVLVECMKKHQKYFPLYNNSTLKPTFLFVADNVTVDNQLSIIEGNERVLAARLEDALFFWKDDLSISLDDWVPKLKGLVYQKNVGSMYDKQKRLLQLFLYFKQHTVLSIDHDVLERLSVLMKVDLVSQMVFEFPELQGVMGRFYALEAGEDTVIADAIQDHYQPLFYGGHLPQSDLSCWASVADRLDHVVVSFYNGAKPTGSQDPLGLRRHLNCLLAILCQLSCSFHFKQMISYSFSLLGDTAKHESRLYEFLSLRLKSFLIDQGLRYDVAESVIHLAYENVSLAVKQGHLIESYRNKDLTQFKQIVETAVRVKRLAAKSETTICDCTLFSLDIERYAYQEFERVAQNNVSLESFFSLVSPLTTYFDDVLVMDKDLTLRQNKLAFLTQVDRLYLQCADFEKIVLD